MKALKWKAGLGLIFALLGLAALRAAIVRPAVHRPSDYRDADVLLRRAGASGWTLSPRAGGSASPPSLSAPSLSSPRLRAWVGRLPAGTAIGLDESPAAVPSPRDSPEGRELRDFAAFCQARGIYFFPIPVA